MSLRDPYTYYVNVILCLLMCMYFSLVISSPNSEVTPRHELSIRLFINLSLELHISLL